MDILPLVVRSALVLASIGAIGCTRGYEPATDTESTAAAPVAAPHAPHAGHAGPLDPSAPAVLPPGHVPIGDAPAPTGVAPTGAPVAGGITWTAPAPLVRRAPAMEMRAAEYAVAGQGAPEAVLTVFHFGAGAGGSVQDNIDRWAGQFQGQGGAPSVPTITHQTASGMAVTVIETTGTMSTGMPGAPEAAPLVASKLLGAIVEGPEGMVFFKFSGPTATVDRGRDAFNALVGSLAPAGH